VYQHGLERLSGSKVILAHSILYRIKQKEELHSAITKATRAGAKDAQTIRHLQYLIQRVATNEEAEHLIMHGWKFVGVLPNGKTVIENSETI
jgi:hypothetical protein